MSTETTTIEMSHIYADFDADTGKISIITQPADGMSDEVGTLTINTKKFDEKTRRYVDDPETYERGLADLAIAGLDIDSLDEADGVTAHLYFDPDEQRVSVRPIRKFTRTARVSPAIQKSLKKNTEPLETLPVEEYEGLRFTVAFPYETKDGVVNLRISQFRVEAEDENEEDTIIGLKYTTRQINDLRDKADEAEDPKMKEKLEGAIEKFVAKSRAAKVSELRSYGIDIEDMLENGGTFQFAPEDIDVQSIPGSGVYFIVATIHPDMFA